MQVVLISGLSGSGKSIALHALEDSGFFCVDNLPATLLPQLIEELRSEDYERVAVAIDVRAGRFIAALPQRLRELQALPLSVRYVFLEARNETLIARFSETRRSHPLSDAHTTLSEAIVEERRLLENVAELGDRIDTSSLAPNALRRWIRDIVQPAVPPGLTLLFVSFGFKYGIPLDADLVFDVRCLPNPYYDPKLRALTGQDAAVAEFLESSEDVQRMAADIRRYLDDWLPAYVRDNRSYLTVALGCTGGQHRSVYLAEALAAHFREQVHVLVRHRALG